MFQPARQFRSPPTPDEDGIVVGLVERARAGDHAAFSALFERYNARICRYLARLILDEDIGRDLAQDTFLAAWRGMAGIKMLHALVPGSIRLRRVWLARTCDAPG